MATASPHHPQPLEQLPDATLLQLFQAEKNREYMGELYRRYRHLAFGMAYRHFRNREEAEDLVSYVFVQLVEKLPGKEIFSFKQYLYGAVRNECLARTRQLKKESARQQEWALTENFPEDFMEMEPGWPPVKESTLEEAVQNALSQLGDEQRTCVTLFFFQGKSYKEIADATGFALNHVKSYLQNGKRNLKKLLESFLEKAAS